MQIRPGYRGDRRQQAIQSGVKSQPDPPPQFDQNPSLFITSYRPSPAGSAAHKAEYCAARLDSVRANI